MIACLRVFVKWLNLVIRVRVRHTTLTRRRCLRYVFASYHDALRVFVCVYTNFRIVLVSLLAQVIGDIVSIILIRIHCRDADNLRLCHHIEVIRVALADIIIMAQLIVRSVLYFPPKTRTL